MPSWSPSLTTAANPQDAMDEEYGSREMPRILQTRLRRRLRMRVRDRESSGTAAFGLESTVDVHVVPGSSISSRSPKKRQHPSGRGDSQTLNCCTPTSLRGEGIRPKVHARQDKRCT